MALRGPNDQSVYTQSQGTPIISARWLTTIPGFRTSNHTFGPSALAAARQEAARTRGIVVSVVAEGDPFNRFQYFAIVDPAKMPGRNGAGGGGGGSGSKQTGPGAVAANALTKQFTGGGQGVDIGVGQARGIASPVQGSYQGINFAAADTKNPPGKATDAINVDGLDIDGAVGPRFGLVQAVPRRFESLTGATGAIVGNYRGRSLNMLSQAFWVSNVPTGIVTYDTSTIGAAGSNYTRTISKQMRTGHNVQFPIDSVKPETRLISTSGGSVNFSVAMPSRYRKSVANGVVESVDQLVVRRSPTGFPRDIDGREYTSHQASMVIGIATVALKDNTAWDGTSVSVNEAGLTAGTTRFYTAWGRSKRGLTEPTYFSVVVA